jgi:ribulose 1,5-bisphosphate synthetase/thiazole synthase
MNLWDTWCRLIAAALLCLVLLPLHADTLQVDIAIVGGTASGFAAAITAARQGMKVALVEPTQRIGGMAVNGVSNTDIKIREALSGVFEEFRAAVAAHYGSDPAAGGGLKYEPKVALAVCRKMLAAESRIVPLLGFHAVKVISEPPGAVRGVVVEDGKGARTEIRARFVIDATDEGDAAAMAGARYRIGREARSPEEPHAGIIYLDRGGITPNDKSVVHRYAILPGSTGEADDRIQAYSFLMIVKDYGPGPQDRPHVLKTPPPGYDPARYKHVAPWAKSWAMQSKIGLPGKKREINQYPYGVELPGENTRYLEGTPQERAAIIERHRNQALGYLYYLQHEEGKWEIGLADDEFEENDHFPVQLYIRQGRRILGHYLLTESDIHPSLKGDGERTPLVRDAIAIGSFPIDVHPVQPKRSPDDPDNGEGELFLPETTTPFQVPYRCLVPLGVEGLLVSQAISSTHIGFQGVRLELIRMSMGMAAAHAAVLAIQQGVTAAAVPVEELQLRLLRSGSILYLYRDVRPGSPLFEPLERLALRGAFQGFESYRFRPEEPCTRAQAAEAIVHALGLPLSVTASHFTDVPRQHPAYKFIETLYDRQALGSLAKTDEKRFQPDATITEAQLRGVLACLRKAAPPVAGQEHPLTRGEAAVIIASEAFDSH